ncbi:polysaccharide pyruvyl transferase family protein [Sphingomonas arenae]|uniref:polysaccharide pyruvyl transferase family protein n=1 Tax=Sphingomonas arenae TaxID=2812555 RepID=UPI0019680C31|nr:polysaccharide pyruvyl transferase family protein [Sphingomonas arenae]
MRVLLLGHFSTVGDIESLEWAEAILAGEGLRFDVASFSEKVAEGRPDLLKLDQVDPRRYTHLVMVCGPLWPDFLRRKRLNLDRFGHCTRIGLNLTMVEPTAEWNPFHVLLERDSDRASRPDLTFLRSTARTPVVGLCTIARQREYGSAQRHSQALDHLRQLVDKRNLAVVEIDTRWPASRNSGGLGSPAQVISVIERMDVLLTNRLHGLVFAMKAGVPALAIDPVAGGNKITAQARTIGWPAVLSADELAPERLDGLLDWCLSEEGQTAARQIAGDAQAKLQSLDQEFRDALRLPPPTPLPRPRSFLDRFRR